MPFLIVRDNIATMSVEAIVNPANTRLKAGGGACGAIFERAGREQLQKECDAIGYCDTGNAVITKGYRLNASYVIHTVGPVWRGGKQGEELLLRSCYQKSLQLAVDNKIKSIAFPLISSGIYGYPKEQALQIAIEEIKKFLENYDDEDEIKVILVIFDKTAFQIGKQRHLKIQEYIDDHYVEPFESRYKRQQRENDLKFNLYQPKTIEKEEIEEEKQEEKLEEQKLEEKLDIAESPFLRKYHLRASERKADKETVLEKGSSNKNFYKLFNKSSRKKTLEDCLSKLEETFSERLLRLIDESGKKDSEVYKKANIDRKHFSKIRSNPTYTPSKKTVIAFAIALELDLDDAKDLLASAGYALSRSNKFDIIIEYYLENEIYDIFEINEVLFAFEQPLLN